MANVELVIKIDKEVYEHILKAKSVPDVLGIDIVNTINAVKNGIPLPKGHGRLIDADKIMTLAHEEGAYDYVSAKEIADAPTIIETDYAGLEEKHLGNPENKTGIYADYEEPKTVSMK